jgi:hypothetical protein
MQTTATLQSLYVGYLPGAGLINSNSTPFRKGPASHSPRSNDLYDNDLADFGARLERCRGPASKENLPKRNKLFGSLRSLRSMAALHSSPNKTKRTDVDRDESPTKHGVSHCWVHHLPAPF